MPASAGSLASEWSNKGNPCQAMVPTRTERQRSVRGGPGEGCSDGHGDGAGEKDMQASKCTVFSSLTRKFNR